METNKYYTPEIEEFYVGFEFEWLNRNTFEKHIFMCQSQFTFDDFPELAKQSRVKYLDQEDIESLGWKEEIDSPDGRFSILKDDIWYYLIQYGHNQKYEIRCMNPSYKYGSFLGTIKNKSELHKLMKQLGINE